MSGDGAQAAEGLAEAVAEALAEAGHQLNQQNAGKYAAVGMPVPESTPAEYRWCAAIAAETALAHLASDKARAVEEARRDALEEAAQLAARKAGSFKHSSDVSGEAVLQDFAFDLRSLAGLPVPTLTELPHPARDDDYGPTAGQL